MQRRRSSLAIQAYHAAIGLAAMQPQPSDTAANSFPSESTRAPCRACGSTARDRPAGQADSTGLPRMILGQASEAAAAISGVGAAGRDIPKTTAN